MALPLTTLTELEAVNYMLSVIGEQPVNSLDDAGITEASLARTVLHHTSREVQAQGLNCNSDKEYPLTPDINGIINLPLNYLSVDASDINLQVSPRGKRLYDKTNHTFTFDKDVPVDIVFFLAFEDLPTHVSHYVTIKAARKFAVNVLGSGTLDDLNTDDETSAKILFESIELRNNDFNIFNNYSSYKIINRRHNPKFRG